MRNPEPEARRQYLQRTIGKLTEAYKHIAETLICLSEIPGGSTPQVRLNDAMRAVLTLRDEYHAQLAQLNKEPTP